MERWPRREKGANNGAKEEKAVNGSTEVRNLFGDEEENRNRGTGPGPVRGERCTGAQFLRPPIGIAVVRYFARIGNGAVEHFFGGARGNVQHKNAHNAINGC